MAAGVDGPLAGDQEAAGWLSPDVWGAAACRESFGVYPAGGESRTEVMMRAEDLNNDFVCVRMCVDESGRWAQDREERKNKYEQRGSGTTAEEQPRMG